MTFWRTSKKHPHRPDKDKFDQSYNEFISQGVPEYIAHRGAEAKAKERRSDLDNAYLKEAENFNKNELI